MPWFWEDPLTGDRARVTNEFRGKVESKSRPSEEVEAQRGEAYIIHARCHLAAATSGGFMYFKNNDPTSEFVITRIYVDAHTLTPTDVIVTQMLNPTPTNGTDIYGGSAPIDSGIIQKNTGSGNILTNVLLTISDGASNLTLADGEEYHAFAVKTMYTVPNRDMKGTNVITQGKAIAWGWESAGTATDGEIVSFSINMIRRTPAA